MQKTFTISIKAVLFVLFLAVGVKGWGQLITEPFNYTASGTNGLPTQSGSVWTNNNSGDEVLVTSGSLTYVGLPSSTGNKIAFDGAGSDPSRLFTSQTSGTVYMSFILNVSALGSLNNTGTYFAGLGSNGTTLGACVWTRKSTTDVTKYNIGISTRTNSTVSWLATDYTIGTSYFIVSGYQIIASTGNDVGKLWINATLGNSVEPATNATAVAQTDLTAVAAVALRQDATTTTPFIEIDELRVGTTWASVTPSGIVAPTVTTTTASSITTISAASGGNVTSVGGASTTRGVVFGTAATPTGNATSDGTSSSTGSYVSSLSGLTANTKYFYRAYATNSAGTSYGLESNFTTLHDAPTVGAGSGETISGFTANWTAPSGGSETFTYTVDVDDDINFGSLNSTVSTIASSDLSTNITGLSSSTTYYYRVKAVNTTGSSAYSATSPGVTTLTNSSPTATISGPIGENVLNGYQLHVVLTNDSYNTVTPGVSDFTLNNAPSGVTIGSVTYNSTTDVTLFLSYSGDFDVNVTTFSVTVSNTILTSGNSNTPLASNAITLIAFNEVITVGSVSAFGTQVVNTPSAEKTYTVAGNQLISSLVITPPTGFQISLTSGSGFVAAPSTLSLLPNGIGTVSSTTIYVRFVPITIQAYNSNITHASANATTQNVAVSGTAIEAEPTTQASGINFTSVTQNAFTINWTNGNGASRIVVVKSGSAVNSDPADGTSYTANTVFGSGAQIGTGNYVVFAGNSASSVTVTGLAGATTYHVAVYEYNGSGGGENYLAGAAIGNQATPTATYTWSAAGTASWATASNWTPSRTTPAVTDILQFSGGGSVTVTGVPAQTIAQLFVSNNSTVAFQSSGVTTLTLAGGTGTDLTIAAGSALNSDGVNALAMSLSTGATAGISGSMAFSNGNHTIVGTDASAITFNNGAVFTAGTGLGTTNTFGTTSLNSVIFASGSTYVHLSGSNPFGATAPSSVVTFQSGSNYKITGNITPSFSGRTYANLEIDAPFSLTGSGGAALSINNLTITQGTLNVNMTTVGASVKGNISVASGQTLTFTPGSASTVSFNGTTAQAIGGAGTLTFGANATVIINNAAGVSLNRDIIFEKALTLTNGTFAVGANTLTLNGTVIGGTTTNLATTSSSSLVFGGSSNSLIVPSSVTNLNNLSFSNTTSSNTLTLNSNITIAGTLTINSGTFRTNTTTTQRIINVNNFTTAGGTINTGTADVTGDVTTVFNIIGDFSNAASFDNTSSTGTARLILKKGGSQNFGNSGTLLYVDAFVNNNSVATLTSDIEFRGMTGTVLTVEVGSILLAGLKLISTTATPTDFTINGTLKTANANGITGTTSTTFVSTNSPTLTINAASTIEFNAASGTQTITSRSDYGNVNFSTGGTKSLGGAITVNGGLTIASGVILTTGASNYAIAIKGNWSNSGTFTPNSNTVTFSGTSGQNYTRTGVGSFNNLTLVNGNGLILNNDLTVASTLLFTSGKINTGSNTLILGSAGSAGTVNGAGSGKYVNGNFRRYVPNTAAPTVSYDIGDATAYTPVSVAFVGTVSGSGYLDALTAVAQPPLASGLSQLKYINRKWTVTNTGVSGFTSYAPTFTFVDGDKVGTPNTSALVIRKLDGSTWSSTTTGSQQANSTQATGIASFSDFFIGETTGSVTVTGQPADVTVCSSSNTFFTSTSSSTPTPAVQWERSTNGVTWVPIDGTIDGGVYSTFTTTTLNLTGVTTGISGYQYHAVFANINGSATSSAATLTVANTWTGNNNRDWQQPNNWSCSIVPSQSDNVIIPFTSNQPIFFGIGVHDINLRDNASNLTLNNFEFTIGGAVTGAGTFIGSPGSSMVINGDGPLGTLNFDQTTDGTTNVLNNFTMNRTSTGTATLGNKLVLLNTYTPTAGVLTTGGNLVLRSNVTSTARIGQGSGSGGYISGDVIVERYIPAKRAWRLLTAPLTGAANNSVFYNWQNNDAVTGTTGAEIWTTTGNGGSSNPGSGNSGLAQGPTSSLLSYNPATDNWVGVTNSNSSTLFNASTSNAYCMFVTGPYANGSGNIATGATATVLSATGSLRTGNTTVSAGSLGAGQYYLLGNPFASPVNPATLSGTNLGNDFNMWDPNLAGEYGVGGYVTFNRTTNQYNVSPSYSNSPLSNIQSGQAFFIQASAAAATDVTFEEGDKTAVVNNAQFRGASTGFEQLRVTLKKDFTNTGNYSHVDGTVAVFHDSIGQSGLDYYDITKFENDGENIALVRSGSNLVFEHRPLVVTANDTLFLKIWNTTSSNYTFSISTENMITMGSMSAILKDKYLLTETPLNLSGTTDYNFTVNSNPVSTGNRFIIVFRKNATLPVSFTGIKAYQQTGGVNVEWNVVNEQGIDSYEIEKSTDGRSFSKAGTTKSTGNNSNVASYAWLDVSPSIGTNYYRVKSKGINGEVKYTSIVSVKLGKAESSISVYPNPVKGSLINVQFTNMAKGEYSINLVNAIGQLVFSKLLYHAGGSSGTQLTLPAHVAKGVYQLKMAGDGASNVQSIVIQ
jgi:hypothetical protein